MVAERPEGGQWRRSAGIVACLLCATLARTAAGDEKPDNSQDRKGIEFFETRIRPVLIKECYGCHSSEAKRVQAGLLVDTREGLLKGGDSGAAVSPGHPEDSLLLEAIRYAGLEMPPSKRLPNSVVSDFETWVRMGAPDPRIGDAAGSDEDPGAGKTNRKDVPALWSFQPPKSPPVPAVSRTDWPREPIDHFILAKCEQGGLPMADDARREVLIRRAALDLTGLPPSPAEIDSFVGDDSPDAYARLVDRMIASEQFGERWGRHWLDVARYADSSGGGRARIFENAWRYRDYVIDSFNDDKPFDRFVAEQIAGDLLPATNPDEEHDSLVATSFLALGPTNYEEQDKEQLQMDVVDEQIDTLGRAFLGMTLGCARCHDHKFDPVSTREYYALAGIFRSTKTLITANVSDWIERDLPTSEDHRKALDDHKLKVDPLKAALASAKENLARLRKQTAGDGQATHAPDVANPSRPSVDELVASVKKLEAELKRLDDVAPSPPPRTMSVQEESQPADFNVCIRGNVHTLGDRVPRGFLEFARPPQTTPALANQSGRKELADWVASPENPLTARVIVNRIWLHLMGAGIVRTADNFGHAGELPSHPELLDWLAVDFMDHGWSVKHTVRRIMLSRTYQLASDISADARRIDPENRLWSRMSRRRLDAEVLRDAMLLAGGHLDTTRRGPSVEPGTKMEFDYKYNSNRRSVYVPVFRNELYDEFELFDVSDPNLVGGRRNISTTATQALYLMNSPFVIDCARNAAERLLAEPMADNSARIDTAYRQVLGRLPTNEERSIAAQFVSTASQGGDGGHRDDESSVNAWAQFYQTLFACIDFRYIE